MFNSKSTDNKGVGQINILAKNTFFVGNIKSEGDFRIDGVLEGDLITKGKIFVGPHGSIKGDCKCLSADIEGKFKGKIVVQNILFLKATAAVYGEANVGKIETETGAKFNASCITKGAEKETSLINGTPKITEKTAS